MMYVSSLLLLASLHFGRCSVVLEASTQGIHLQDYCPKMQYCSEGTHVMCMYYNPDREMGPRCTKPKNISVTPDLAQRFLEISNAARSKIALGMEKGKDGELFPRGYGIYRLAWDSELATFAQVLANQCLLKHDMCRATKKFPDPGQNAGLVRFSYPEWKPIQPNTGLDRAGLYARKLDYAIRQALKTWYTQKSKVSSSMITSLPDWTLDPAHQYGRLYLEMIYGPATHMGCGMSAYTEYAYYDNNAALNYNSVQIICNYSHRGRKGGPMYEVSPPTKVGYTVKCGCPPGMDEDGDCLCYESTRNAITTRPIGRDCSMQGHSCKPSVVLLPIFTVENAPPDKLAARSGPEEKKESEMEIMDLYPTANQSMFNPMATHRQATSVLTNLIKEVHNIDYVQSSTPKPHKYTVQSRYFDNKHTAKSLVRSPTQYGFTQPKKESVFAKVPTFDLSKKVEHNIKNSRKVLPRRDFSNMKNLVQTYLNGKKHHTEPNVEHTKPSPNFQFFDHKIKTTTEPYLQLQKSAEEKLINFNSLLKNKLDPNMYDSKIFSDIESDSSKEKSNDKLMNLLDKLEQEVKHIELDKTKKDIFDAKIRKIYGTVVGRANADSDFELSNNDTYKLNHNIHADTGNSHVIDHVSEGYQLGKPYNLGHNREYLTRNDLHNDIRSFARHENDIDINNIDHLNKDYGVDMKHGYSDNEGPRSKFLHQSFSDTEELKTRNSYIDKEALRSKHIYSDGEEKERMKDLENRNHLQLSDHEDEPLGIERRKFYQDKLDKIVRKVHNTRKLKHHSENNPLMRPLIRPSRGEEHNRNGKAKDNAFYVPDRARFLHGF